ncbi:MAG: nucleotide sugar dehydrogenase [Clostridia bacterium]|nr:nucleotide sugar dehydrogenase [Clostridia bacterium]
MKICIIGLGYIGIPTATMFASKGYEVIGVDIRENVVKAINSKHLPIEEKGLSELFSNHPFKASLTPEIADVFIICVGTPTDENRKVDLTAVISASRDIAPYIKRNDLVILESTVPPGTTNDIVLPILEKENLKAGVDFNLVHSPERVIPGNMLQELLSNDRIMGGITREGAVRAKELYSSFVKGQIYVTDAKTAETAKLMENTFRTVNIALANEVAMISETLGINAWEVIELANKHPRVNIHSPGPGVGGHCIPVDPWFIVEKAPEESQLIRMSLEKNHSMPAFTVNRIFNILGGEKGFKICLLGATYKANTDDIRESPTFDIVRLLEKENQVTLYDPHVNEYSEKDLYDCCESCDLLVLLVDHQQFKDIDYLKLHKIMKKPQLFDTKNFINRKSVTELGFSYHLLGDGSLKD